MGRGHSSDVLLHVGSVSEAWKLLLCCQWRECSWSFRLESSLSDGSVHLIIMFAVKINLPTLLEKERGRRGLGSYGKCPWGNKQYILLCRSPQRFKQRDGMTRTKNFTGLRTDSLSSFSASEGESILFASTVLRDQDFVLVSGVYC